MENERREQGMIPFDFDYYRPTAIKEALTLFQQLDQAGKKPMYYGGGTEIISMGRMNNIFTGAVIDLKDIPICHLMEIRGEWLLIGAAVTLTQIHEANLYPLLSLTGARVADHTIQNKITLGGNLCGSIIYREAVLPLLLADSEVVIASPAGKTTLPINQIFNQRMQINNGEFIIQIRIPQKILSCPHIHVKRTKQDKINYPLATICALRADNQVMVAFSGVCDFPFRSLEMEAALNDTSLPVENRVENALNKVPVSIPTNLEGYGPYRKYLLKNLLISIITELGG